MPYQLFFDLLRCALHNVSEAVGTIDRWDILNLNCQPAIWHNPIAVFDAFADISRITPHTIHRRPSFFIWYRTFLRYLIMMQKRCQLSAYRICLFAQKFEKGRAAKLLAVLIFQQPNEALRRMLHVNEV
jgi:hypothetical protein